MFLGNKIYTYLIKNINKRETESSSHWNYYHQDFKFENGKLRGIKGFGHNHNYYGFFSNSIHFLFQRKYFKMSSKSSFFKEINQSAILIAKKQKRAYGLDVLRQTLTLDFLKQKSALKKTGTVLIIGDGFGTMTSLLLENKLSKHIFIINLRKTLLVDLIYLEKVIGQKRFNQEVVLINQLDDIKKVDSSVRVIAIEAENYTFLKLIEKDLVINIASFQEMDMNVIHNYFDYLYAQRNKPFYLYLCNREEKTLPDGSKIAIAAYNLNNKDKILVDELCPWHQDFYTFRPPFIKKYDGPTRHQLRRVNH